LALLALIAASAVSAKCYPPNTRVVIFIQGMYSSYDASGTASDGVEMHTFEALKNTFAARRYDRAKLLDFSYAGGTVTPDGAWQPAAYTCEQTDRTSADNLVPLEQMLRDYRAKHSDAHFTLVGHSLGGYLAFLEGAREARRAESDRLGIDVVVPLDAPIGGVNADKRIAIDLLPCNKTFAAGAELVAARQDPATTAARLADGTAMAQQGIRLATLGNNFDCVYNLPACIGSGTDDTASQFVATAAFSRAYDLHVSPLISHFVILTDPQADADTIWFVGAP
jgi:pimeloyl-ACP methyl ester carboxylesterase